MKKSAGLLLFRRIKSESEFFLVHPGGPLWAKKADGAWSIPKGEFEDDEDPFKAALREFEEETGIKISVDTEKIIALNVVKLKSGKIVYAWLMEGNADAEKIKSNTFELEFPPRSGKKIIVPEVDKAAWFTAGEARKKINPGQVNLIEQAEKILNE